MEQLTYTRCIKQMLPSIKERKQGPLPKPLDFSTIFPALPSYPVQLYMHAGYTNNRYTKCTVTEVQFPTDYHETNKTNFTTTYWHQLIKMTIGSYYNKNKYV